MLPDRASSVFTIRVVGAKEEIHLIGKDDVQYNEYHS